jgi:hypothetical protein
MVSFQGCARKDSWLAPSVVPTQSRELQRDRKSSNRYSSVRVGGWQGITHTEGTSDSMAARNTTVPPPRQIANDVLRGANLRLAYL